MIQLNLLPDVKLEYIKAEKLRSLVASISVIVTAIAVVILVIMLIVDFAQKADISSVKNQINTSTSTLKAKPSINTILTVQNQLKSLTSLYASRPVASSLFTTYLSQVTPEAVSLNQFTADFVKHNLVLSGATNNLTTVNQYVDTLKLTTYSINGSSSSTGAFSNIVLTNFGYNSDATNPAQAASFTIDLDFDPNLFSATQTINLNIPNIILTHAQSADINSLFEPIAGKGGQ